jgi:hypothetical protein
MNPLQHTIAEVTQFVRQPQYRQPLALTATPRLVILRQVVSELPITLVLAGLIAATLVGTNTLIIQNWSPGISIEGKRWEILLAAVVLIPILLELVFRAPMRLTPGRLGWLTFVLGLVIIGSLLKPVEARLGLYEGSWLVSGWMFLGPLLAWFITRPARYARIERGWQQNFRWVFYVLTALYATVYTDGLDLQPDWHLLLFPAVFVPGLLAGFYLGYVRMKYGYWYAVLVSGLMNVVPLLIALGKL